MEVHRLFREALSLHRKGRLAEARGQYARILAEKPDFAPARLFLALILQQAGMGREALDNARRAMADAESPDAGMLVNYGIILKNAGLYEEAYQAYREALDMDPVQPLVKANLATLMMLTGRLLEAEAMFFELTQVLEDPAPWFNLARIALERGDWDKAGEYLQKAEDKDPAHPDLDLLRAQIAVNRKDDEKAFGFLKKTLSRAPVHVEAWRLMQGLAAHVIDPGFIESVCAKLVASDIRSVTILAAAVNLCRRHLAWAHLPKLEAMLSKALDKPLGETPFQQSVFTLLGVDISQEKHLKVAAASWRHVTSGAKPLPPRTVAPRAPGQKVKVAFLSSDLRSHAAGYLLAGLAENLPRKHIEWWAYNNSFGEDTTVRSRLRDSFDRFLNVSKLEDEALAHKIREDMIDVLIDLNGRTRDTRVTVMAWRPAPVQVTWLGMPGSTGSGKDIDYVIGDPWVTGEVTAPGFSEHILQLPGSYFTSDHVPPDYSLAGSRLDHQLPGEAFVFCSFNQYFKMSPETFDLWCRILQQSAGAVLWLQKPGTSAMEGRLRRYLKDSGVDPDRLVLAEKLSRDRHLARLRHADLVLDTWPYNAHTTCVDALQAGTPVLTLPGETFASRAAASILEHSDLAEWIVDSPESYVEKALRFAARGREAVDAVKEETRQAFWNSPMVDNAARGRIFEALCLGLYDRTARGEPLQDLKLNNDMRLEPLPFLRQGKNTADNEETGSGEWLKPGPVVASPPAQAPPRASNSLIMLQRDIIGLAQPPLVVEARTFAGESASELGRLADDGLLEWHVFTQGEPVQTEPIDDPDHPRIRHRREILGDGRPGKLHICKGAGADALSEPNLHLMSMFEGPAGKGGVVRTRKIQTTRLDDTPAAASAALIVCDTNGSEWLILKNSTAALKRAVFVELRLSPTPVYNGEASLFRVGSWMEDQGWMLHCLPRVQNKTILSGDAGEELQGSFSHVFQLRAVFMPDFRRWKKLEDTRLRELAFLAHVRYRSFDLAARALYVLGQRRGGNQFAAYKRFIGGMPKA